MKKSYVLTRNFSGPYVVQTGQPHRPTQIKLKKFTAGQIINGELKHANGRPAFVLVYGVIPVPLVVLKAVVTKEITQTTSNADGGGSQTVKKVDVITNPKVKYIDAGLIGAIVGLGAVLYAEKKTWIATPTKENKIAGAVIGAAIGAYITYRLRNKKDVKLTEKPKD